ncbi:hypothetical protein BURPS668_0738 [Burkholderia pseudomallei 668]|nr:hypothetical protein BURPS668_0738 [Burkholderia pseudomallei 668]
MDGAPQRAEGSTKLRSGRRSPYTSGGAASGRIADAPPLSFLSCESMKSSFSYLPENNGRSFHALRAPRAGAASGARGAGGAR